MTQLFRREALQHRGGERLYGEVALVLPVSWQIIGALLFVGLGATFLFLALAPYSQVESVQGAIVPDRGIAEILPGRPGTIAAIEVRDGAKVTAGQPLVRIRASEATAGGRPLDVEVTAAIARQDAELAGQTAQMQAAATAEQGRISAQISGLADEVRQLDEQIRVQQELVASAKADLDNAKEVAGRGFISRRDLQLREDSYLGRLQQLSQLLQARSGKLASLEEARRSSLQASAQARAQTSSLQSSRAALAERLVGAGASGAYLLQAPVDGTVTALTARVGQAATADKPLMAIVPTQARLRAELYVPTRAAGFLKKGQDVRLAIDAFPYQQFGTVEAKIEEISSAPVNRATPAGGTESVYLVAATIPDPEVKAFGERRRLVPGMALSARIVTREQSLFEWLFEPLFAVSRR